ncbi:MAG TPA: T9SS type A sorting domain-containing protein [Candidatus Babeliaceae bacterium]|nr:T9SS type A sorting domain-containing protein [Candidatus Babeliaceae bacterium]
MQQFLRILFIQLLVCLTTGAFTQTTLTYTTPGTVTWSPPAGVTSITLQMWGAGGYGFFGSFSGGGGAFVQTTSIPVVYGTSYDIIVGSGFGSSPNSSFGPTGGSMLVVAQGGSTNSTAGGAASSGTYVATSYRGGNGAFPADYFSPAGGGAGAGTCQAGADGSAGSGYGAGACGGGSGGDPNGNGAGGAPGGGGACIFGNNNTVGGNGKVLLTYTCNVGNTGQIGNAHTITYPPEMTPDNVTSIVDPSLESGVSIIWQQSTDNVNFVSTKTPTSSTTYRFDLDSLQTNTYYRRGNNACLTAGTVGNWSDTVKITVAGYGDGTGTRNGSFDGHVLAINGTGIKQRLVFAKSLTPLLGRSVGFLDSALTDDNGFWHMDSVFYGDHNNGDSSSVRFLLYSDTSNHHLYKPINETLTFSKHSYTGISIFDSSAFAITGQVYQKCDNCLNSNNVATTIKGPLDSVFVKGIGAHDNPGPGGIIQNERDSSKTGYRANKGTYGNYNLTFQYNDIYTVTPTYLNHKFKPADSVVNLTGNISKLDFVDTTTHVISGTFSAGCGDVIGSAVLEFDDSLHIGYDSLPQKSVFRKRVTTNANGKYSIRLPARAYTVKVISYSGHDNTDPGTTQTSIKNYFNSLRSDTAQVHLVYRDISTKDTVLNLEYHRAPQIAIIGLRDDSIRVNTCLATQYKNYDFWPQGVKRPIRFYVYQGPASKGCLTDTGKVTIKTDISTYYGRFNYDTVAVSHGVAIDSIVAAMPNTSTTPGDSAYSKTITAKYTDILKRSFSTDTSKPALPIIVVTGASIDPSGTDFVTVSPQLPMLVLHDPPGSTSFAEWEQEVSSSKTISFSTKTATSLGTFIKAKIGLKELIGLFVETDIEAEVGIDAELNTTRTYASTDESTLTTSSVETLSTSDDPAYIGTDADIVKGQALNIDYREGLELDWDSTKCQIIPPKPIMVTDVTGVGTTYDYTIGSLRDEEIPRLERAAVASTNPDSARFFRSQEGVWQQLIDQNYDNIKSAPVIGNQSFSNGTSDKLSSTLTNDRKNTYQFDIDVDGKIANDIGFDIAGNGLTFGVSVGFAATIGGDSSFTSSTSTTTSYTLADNNAGLSGKYSGDYVSVNIKRDPVYGTPMFETVAGGTQCPHEGGTVSLYHPVISAKTTQLTDVTRDTAQFTIYLNNLSLDPIPGGKRTYLLFADAASINSAGGPGVKIGSSDATIPQSFDILNNGGQQPVIIDIIRNTAGGIYDYDNIKFIMTDPCFSQAFPTNFYQNPHEYDTILLSADFASPVSGVTLVSPANKWFSNKSNHDTIPVVFSGYTLSGLSSIAVQYNVPGASTWTTLSTIAKANLGATSTTYYWKTSKLADGAYNLRLQVKDKSGNIIYSSVATGVIDRIPPALFGIPEPRTGIYAVGTQISYNYTEKIDSALRPSMVQLRDLTTSKTIATQLSAFLNKMIILPATSIIGSTNHRFRVIVDSVADLHGNVKTTPDTTYFTVGTSTFGTGSDALNITTTPGSIYEDSKGSLAVKFTRNSKILNDTAVIYYTIAGNAVLNRDYTLTYNAGQNTNSITGIIGSDGRILLPNDSSKVTMYIHPINDSMPSPDKILNIFLSPGGNYTIGSSYSVADTILNHNTVAPIITANKSTTLCSGDSVTLSTANKINGVGVKSYAWSTGAKTQSITVKTSGSYTVKVTDNKGFIGYSAPTVVTVTCGSPINLATNVLSKSSAILKWDTISCAKKYTVKYRQVGTTTWKNDTLNTNKDTVKSLKANTTYEWKVASICQYPKVILSTYAVGSNFTTPASLGDIIITSTTDHNQAIAGDGFSASIFPNPASTSANIVVKHAKGSYNIMVENLQGEILWKAEDVNDDHIKLPLQNLASGVYMILVTDGTHKGMLKLVKQ